MKLSTKTRYAARAMMELAAVYPDETLSAKQVAMIQGISVNYLEQIMSSLRAAGLVKAVRGMHGGFALSRPPASITLKEVFEALEGSVAPVGCVDHPGSCPMEQLCPTRQTWVEMKESIEKVLERTTLQGLLERKKQKGASSTPMYHI